MDNLKTGSTADQDSTKTLHLLESMLSTQSSGQKATIDELRLMDHWRLLKRHKWGIMGLVFAAMLVGALTVFSMRPVYRAEVTMLIEPEQPKIVSVDPLQSATNIHYFYETQYEIIRSRSVAETVIRKLNLDKHKEFTKETKGLLDILISWIPESWRLEKNKEPSQETKNTLLVNRFRKGLSVHGESQSQIVVVSYDSYDPLLAAEIANTVSDSYVEQGMESRLAVAKQAASWLTERLAELRSKLAESEKALQMFQSREGVVDSTSQQNIISRKLSSITEELVKAQTKLTVTKIRYDQVKGASVEGRGYESLQAVLQHPLVQALKEEESRLARRASELGERYGKRHPKMIAVTSDLKEAKRLLKGEVSKVVDGIRREYEVAMANERALARLNEKMKSDIRNLKGKEFKLAKLERDVATNRQLYDLFLTRFKETDLAGSGNVTNVRVLDKAKPPLKPYSPRKVLAIVFSMSIGLLLGIVLAYTREHMDATFKMTDDIEKQLNLPSLGALPLLTKKDLSDTLPEKYCSDQQNSPYSEAINSIRTGVMFSNLDNPPKTLLVTSALANTGKTTLCRNLATSFSHLGKTLVIDADLRKPRLAGIAGQKTYRAGLTDYVSGQKNLNDCVIRDSKSENLFVMTCGAKTPNPLEFLSSEKMRHALSDLKRNFDYVLIDTTPMLSFSEAIVLAHLVDSVIFVVKSFETTYSIAQNAVKKLNAAQITPIGVVLSHLDERRAESYDSYYYSASYYEYYNEAPEKTKGALSYVTGALALALLAAALLLAFTSGWLTAFSESDIIRGLTQTNVESKAVSSPLGANAPDSSR